MSRSGGRQSWYKSARPPARVSPSRSQPEPIFESKRSYCFPITFSPSSSQASDFPPKKTSRESAHLEWSCQFTYRLPRPTCACSKILHGSVRKARKTCKVVASAGNKLSSEEFSREPTPSGANRIKVGMRDLKSRARLDWHVDCETINDRSNRLSGKVGERRVSCPNRL